MAIQTIEYRDQVLLPLGFHIGVRPTPEVWGARSDCVFLPGSLNDTPTNQITAGSNILFCPDADFQFEVKGKTFWIEGAGPDGGDLLTTALNYIDTTHVELAQPAQTTVPAARVRFGTDNTIFFQRAIDRICEIGRHGSTEAIGALLTLTRGSYLITGSLVPRHNLTIEGCGYSGAQHDHRKLPTAIIGCGNVPIFKSVDPLVSFQVRNMCFVGTNRSGSMGFDLSESYNGGIEYCTFDTFGDHAVLVRSGVDGFYNRLRGQNIMMVRTGRTDYVGCFDINVHDAVMNYVAFTASSITDGSGYGDGYICGLVVRGANGFANNCYGDLSQVGIFSNSSLWTWVNCRADLNYGHGWVLGGGGQKLNCCRSHNNSLEEDGGFNAYEIIGGTHAFLGSDISYNGPSDHTNPFFFRTKHGFHTDIQGNVAATHFVYCTPEGAESCVEETYKFSGDQKTSVVKYATSLEILGTETDVCRAHLYLPAGKQIIMRSDSPDATEDGATWVHRLNYGTGYNQYTLDCVSDDFQSGKQALLIDRDGLDVRFYRFFAKSLSLFDRNAPEHGREWNFTTNYPEEGSDYNQLLFAAPDETTSTGEIYFRISRNGGTITAVDFLTGLLTSYNQHTFLKRVLLDPSGSGSDQSTGAGVIELGSSGVCKILYYHGNPNGNVTANPPTICFDPVGGDLWGKFSGTGNTGWGRISRWWLQAANDLAANRPLTLDGSKVPTTAAQIDATWVGSGNISNTEFEFLNDIDTNIKAKLTDLEDRIASLEGAGPFVSQSEFDDHGHQYQADGGGALLQTTGTPVVA